MQKYTIDAAGKRLGRVASDAAKLLRGKGNASFTHHELPDVEVEIRHASKVVLSAKKRTDTRHTRYSGYPGGFRSSSLDEMITVRGFGGVFRKVVLGMLPRNRLRAKLIKRLRVRG